MRDRRHPIALEAAFALAACTATAPEVNLPTTGSVDAGPRYADVFLSSTLAGRTTDCASQLPDCDAGTAQPSSSPIFCGASPVLGPPHDAGLLLSANDDLVVGFLCDGYITSHRDGGDLVLYATLANQGYAVVEASQDGTAFSALGIYDGGTRQTFSLSAIPTDRARFVRVTGEGAGLVVEAVQAL